MLGKKTPGRRHRRALAFARHHLAALAASCNRETPGFSSASFLKRTTQCSSSSVPLSCSSTTAAEPAETMPNAMPTSRNVLLRTRGRGWRCDVLPADSAGKRHDAAARIVCFTAAFLSLVHRTVAAATRRVSISFPAVRCRCRAARGALVPAAAGGAAEWTPVWTSPGSGAKIASAATCGPGGTWRVQHQFLTTAH